MKKFFFRSRKYFDSIEKERDEVDEKIDINLRYLSNVSLMKTRYFIIIVNADEKFMITFMSVFELRVKLSLAIIIMSSFRLNSSDGFDSLSLTWESINEV
jgi:hypothetical protein